MKAITNQQDLPKMLVVNSEIDKYEANSHLLKPFKKGELVKVNPEQLPATKMTAQQFQNNYVSVIRKDDKGEWRLIYTLDWKYFSNIGKK